MGSKSSSPAHATDLRWLRLLPRAWDGPPCYIFELWDNDKLLAQSYPIKRLQDLNEVEEKLIALLIEGGVEQDAKLAHLAISGGKQPWFSSLVGPKAPKSFTAAHLARERYVWISELLAELPS